MTKTLLIERAFQGFGLLMTLGLFLFLRKIVVQVRSESSPAESVPSAEEKPRS
jgi:hypothetical protein